MGLSVSLREYHESFFGLNTKSFFRIIGGLIYDNLIFYAVNIYFSFCSLSYDRSTASSKANSPHSAI